MGFTCMIAKTALGLSLLPGLVMAEPFLPEDPMLQPDPGGLHEGQWYLKQARFPAAWQAGATGRGVIIGIVDNRFGQPHPDLEPARHPDLDLVFEDVEDALRGMTPDGESHGLMVAGVAAARGGNGQGICGAAPKAGLVWIRSGGPMKTEAMIRYDPNPARRVRIKNYSIGLVNPFQNPPSQAGVRRAFRESAEQGMIHVIAAGNEGGWAGGDCGKSPLCSSPHVLVVAACDRDRRRVDWSGFGGVVVACAPSTEALPDKGLLTTGDASGFPLAGDPLWTNSFGGTSAATPQVTGLMAMGVEVLPGLDSRLAKHLLAKSCRPLVDESPELARNAAGQWHSPWSGFGMIDAGRFIALARQRPRLTPLILEPARSRDDVLGLQSVVVRAGVPDGNRSGLTRTFRVSGSQAMEELEIHLEIKHPDRGQLTAWLESPSGTRRELFAAHPVDHQADMDWIFVTQGFWGENPQGEWSLTVADGVPGEAGEWEAFGWRVRMGRLVDP